jgi:hypothetical protein
MTSFGPYGSGLGGHNANVVPDPYSLVPPVASVAGGATCGQFPDWDNINGRVQVNLSSLTGTTLVLVIAGQSLSTNCVNSTYTPTNTGKVLNFSICDGGTYQSKDPHLGCTGYHPNLPSNPWPTGLAYGSRLADLLINAGKATNVILVPIGVGGSNILDWQVGGGNNPRIAVTAARLAAAGLSPTAFLFNQGTSNNNGTTQVTYQTAGASMISTIRAQSGWTNVPIFIAQESMASNGTTSAAVRAAQAALVDHVNKVWAGPDTDSLNNTNRQSDNLHWNATGSAALAALWQTALGLYGAPF